MFSNICAIKLPNDIIKLSITKIQDIREDAKYPGYRLSIHADIQGINVNIKVDVSTGDVITKKEIEYEHKLLFEDRIVQIMAYTTETIIAEKLETIVNRMETNTRLKDFYDLYLFDHQNIDKINFENLQNAIKATAKNRGTYNQLDNYVPRILKLKNSIDLLKRWKLYQSANTYAKGIDFLDTCNSAADLVKRSYLR